MIIGLIFFFLTFLTMEYVAWAAHKYLMHGFLWNLHQDHHVITDHVFQKNDAFFLIFAIPSWLCIMLGFMYQNYISTWIGFGIAFYGLAYFLIHEVFIHRRFRGLKQINHPYFIAIRKAHKMHHKVQTKEHGVCFGMLLVPYKYYKEAKLDYSKIHKK